jgi:K(+)-stimulated pyrophosphate-energized sodium pump
MNLVALIIAPAIVGLSVGEDANTTLRVLIALGAVAVIVVSVVISKRRSVVVGGAPSAASDGKLTTTAP